MLKNVHFREKILWHKQGFPVHNRFANWLFIQLTKGFHFQKLDNDDIFFQVLQVWKWNFSQ